MTTESRQRLLDALESCETIRRYTDGIDVIHGYADVNAEIVWDVVQNKLPSVQTRLAALLGKDTPQ